MYILVTDCTYSSWFCLCADVFFSLSMALMVASLLVTLLVVKLNTNMNSYPRVPRWLRILVLDYLARILFMSPQRPAPADVILNPNSKGNRNIILQHI